MPELPEVEIMAGNLNRWTGGVRVSHMDVVDPRVVAGGDPHRACGLRVRGAWRRAKYAVLDLEDEGHLVFHFRMTGKVIRRRLTAKSRLWFRAGDAEVAFEDARCLGQIWWVDAGRLDAFFTSRNLGPEPWPESRSGAWWAERLSGLRGPIKPALMRQERVAGIGNILASESCWRAQVHPAAPVPSLQASDWNRLAQSIHQTIAHTLQAESGEEIIYVNQGGPGSFSVYGHAGSACKRCGGIIQRMVQSGRGTFFCPGCQPSL